MASLSPKFLSENEIRQDLMDIVAAQPDADKWSDWFSGGVGTTILDQLTAVASFLGYQAVASRREGNPLYAKLKTTIYSSAALFGYPINRKQCAKLILTVNSPEQLFWDKANPFGYFNGSPVSLAESQQLIIGRNTALCYLGSWESASQTVNVNEEYHEFHIPLDYSMEYVCNEQVQVFVNDKPVPLSPFIEDMQDGKVVLLTYADSLSIMFGGNTRGIKVKKGDEIRVDWIRLKESNITPETQVFSPKTFQPVDNLVLEGVEVLRRETQEDSLSKIVKLMPAYFSTRRRMVNPADHEAIINSCPGIISAKFAPGTCTTQPLFNYNQESCSNAGGDWEDAAKGQCCTKVVSYLRDDQTPLTDEEEEDLYNRIRNRYMIAGSYVILQPGIPVTIMPKLVILIEQNFKEVDKLKGYVENIIRARCNILEGQFKVGELIAEVNKLNGVRYSYISRPYKDMQLSWQGYFNLGKLDIRITSNESDLLKYGGEEGGYLPYTNQVKGVMLKSWADKLQYFVGDTIVIKGYVVSDGDPVVGSTITLDINGQTKQAVTQGDGTFYFEYPTSSNKDVQIKQAVLHYQDKTDTLQLVVLQNMYKLTLKVQKDLYNKGDKAVFQARLLKNDKPFEGQTLSFNKQMSSDTTDHHGIIYHTEVVESSAKMTVTYTDKYGVKVEASLDYSMKVPDNYALSISTDAKSYLSFEPVTVKVKMLNNGKPCENLAIAIHPIYDGVSDDLFGRTALLNKNGEGQAIYVVDKQDVARKLNGFIARYEVDGKLIASSSTFFTTAYNPNGNANGFE